jgi:hypothetical protein
MITRADVTIIIFAFTSRPSRRRCLMFLTPAEQVRLLSFFRLVPAGQAGAAAAATSDTSQQQQPDWEVAADPVQLAIFSHRFMGIAEQMGRTLQRTSIRCVNVSNQRLCHSS